jgi:phosphocarrier protein HPr
VSGFAHRFSPGYAGKAVNGGRGAKTSGPPQHTLPACPATSDKGAQLPARKAVVQASVGLHARPAAAFVRAVTQSGLPVTISKQGRPGVDARSLLEVMTEDFSCGCEVELAVAAEAVPAGASPGTAERVLAELCALLESLSG